MKNNKINFFKIKKKLGYNHLVSLISLKKRMSNLKIKKNGFLHFFKFAHFEKNDDNQGV
jgi:hypothetical protein